MYVTMHAMLVMLCHASHLSPRHTSHISGFQASLLCCDATCTGVEWKTLNAGQKQLRRDMKPLYGTPRALLQLRPGSTIKRHAYPPLFSLQVRYVMLLSCSLPQSLPPPLTHSHPVPVP